MGGGEGFVYLIWSEKGSGFHERRRTPLAKLLRIPNPPLPRDVGEISIIKEITTKEKKVG